MTAHPSVLGRSVGILSAAALLAVAATSDARLADTGTASIRFRATGPAGLAIDGQTSDFRATEQDDILRLTVPLGNLQTGLDLRDRHLREYLETSKYPDATLEVSRGKLRFPEDGKAARSSASGTLTLHGTSQSWYFNYQVKRIGSEYLVQGLGNLDIRDFGIEVPCYLGVCVDPHVKLNVKFKLIDR